VLRINVDGNDLTGVSPIEDYAVDLILTLVVTGKGVNVF
jgi:hypothetical protein